jgi:hypothetical protein
LERGQSAASQPQVSERKLLIDNDLSSWIRAKWGWEKIALANFGILLLGFGN